MVRNSNRGSARLRARADGRRLEILRAAARVFRRRGYAAAGMREIAAEAELSAANLYHYFRGKPEILYFCQDRALDTLLGALDQARRGRGPVPGRIGALIRAHVLCLLEDLEGSAAHLEVDALPPRLRGRIVAKRDRYEKGLRLLIASGVRRGEIEPCDASLVARAILGAANWSVLWFRPGGASRASDVADDLSFYLVRGLLARPGARALRRRIQIGAGSNGRP